MTNLNHYMQDGAGKQARAVLAYLQGNTIEESWNDATKNYDAEPQVARWENCREQGYVVSLNFQYKRWLRIAFFEHRNSDAICAIRWEQGNLINSPTIDTARFGEQCYKDKWDVSKEVSPGRADEMAEWIQRELEAFWDEASRPVDRVEIQPS